MIPLIIIFGLFTKICYYLDRGTEKFVFKKFPNQYTKDLRLLLFWVGTVWSTGFIFWMEYGICLNETSPLPPTMR